MLTIFHVQNVLSFSTDVYVIFLYWNIWLKCMHFIFICHLLMLTYFCVVNVPEFQYCFWLFTDVDYFSCAKCSHHFQLMFMWFSCTETYWWSAHTSSSFVIYWCWHIFVWKCSRISIVFLIIYWCWLFFMCKMFSIIFDWCLCDFLVLKHIDEVYTLHLHLSLTDVDIFLCCKCSRISILFLIIYWCWLFFMCKMFYHFRLMFMWFSCTETYWWSVHTSSSFVIYWCWHFCLWKIF